MDCFRQRLKIQSTTDAWISFRDRTAVTGSKNFDGTLRKLESDSLRAAHLKPVESSVVHGSGRDLKRLSHENAVGPPESCRRSASRLSNQDRYRIKPILEKSRSNHSFCQLDQDAIAELECGIPKAGHVRTG